MTGTFCEVVSSVFSSAGVKEAFRIGRAAIGVAVLIEGLSPIGKSEGVTGLRKDLLRNPLVCPPSRARFQPQGEESRVGEVRGKGNLRNRS